MTHEHEWQYWKPGTGMWQKRQGDEKHYFNGSNFVCTWPGCTFVKFIPDINTLAATIYDRATVEFDPSGEGEVIAEKEHVRELENNPNIRWLRKPRAAWWHRFLHKFIWHCDEPVE